MGNVFIIDNNGRFFVFVGCVILFGTLVSPSTTATTPTGLVVGTSAENSSLPVVSASPTREQPFDPTNREEPLTSGSLGIALKKKRDQESALRRIVTDRRQRYLTQCETRYPTLQKCLACCVWQCTCCVLCYQKNIPPDMPASYEIAVRDLRRLYEAPRTTQARTQDEETTAGPTTNPCDQEPCENGGKCYRVGGGRCTYGTCRQSQEYYCICQPPSEPTHKGRNCEHPITRNNPLKEETTPSMTVLHRGVRSSAREERTLIIAPTEPLPTQDFGTQKLEEIQKQPNWCKQSCALYLTDRDKWRSAKTTDNYRALQLRANQNAHLGIDHVCENNLNETVDSITKACRQFDSIPTGKEAGMRTLGQATVTPREEIVPTAWKHEDSQPWMSFALGRCWEDGNDEETKFRNPGLFYSHSFGMVIAEKATLQQARYPMGRYWPDPDEFERECLCTRRISRIQGDLSVSGILSKHKQYLRIAGAHQRYQWQWGSPGIQQDYHDTVKEPTEIDYPTFLDLTKIYQAMIIQKWGERLRVTVNLTRKLVPIEDVPPGMSIGWNSATGRAVPEIRNHSKLQIDWENSQIRWFTAPESDVYQRCVNSEAFRYGNNKRMDQFLNKKYPMTARRCCQFYTYDVINRGIMIRENGRDEFQDVTQETWDQWKSFRRQQVTNPHWFNSRNANVRTIQPTYCHGRIWKFEWTFTSDLIAFNTLSEEILIQMNSQRQGTELPTYWPKGIQLPSSNWPENVRWIRSGNQTDYADGPSRKWQDQDEVPIYQTYPSMVHDDPKCLGRVKQNPKCQQPVGGLKMKLRFWNETNYDPSHNQEFLPIHPLVIKGPRHGHVAGTITEEQAKSRTKRQLGIAIGILTAVIVFFLTNAVEMNFMMNFNSDLKDLTRRVNARFTQDEKNLKKIANALNELSAATKEEEQRLNDVILTMIKQEQLSESQQNWMQQEITQQQAVSLRELQIILNETQIVGTMTTAELELDRVIMEHLANKTQLPLFDSSTAYYMRISDGILHIKEYGQSLAALRSNESEFKRSVIHSRELQKKMKNLTQIALNEIKISIEHVNGTPIFLNTSDFIQPNITIPRSIFNVSGILQTLKNLTSGAGTVAENALGDLGGGLLRLMQPLLKSLAPVIALVIMVVTVCCLIQHHPKCRRNKRRLRNWAPLRRQYNLVRKRHEKQTPGANPGTPKPDKEV